MQKKLLTKFNIHLYSEVIYDEGGENMQWSDDSLFNQWCWKNCTHTLKKIKCGHSPLPHTKRKKKDQIELKT